MEFKIKDNVPVPEIQRGFSHGSPWDDMKPGQSFEVPQDYWLRDRNMPEEKATAKDAMRRIRSNFIKWRQAV